MNSFYKFLLGDYSKVGLSNKENRHKWIKEKLGQIPAGLKILDAGAGEQQFKPFCRHLKYTSQDFGKYDGIGDGKGIQMGKWDNRELDIVSDITDIPAESDFFDIVFCSEVLQHLPRPSEAIREMLRVLKPGGTIILTAPFASITHFSPFHYSSGFNKYFYEYWLKEFNCEILQIEFNGNYFEFVAQEIRYSEFVGKKFAGLKFSFMEKLAQRVMLSFLQKASEKAPESRELLAFGLFITARKK